jgi:hypothetical protein
VKKEKNHASSLFNKKNSLFHYIQNANYRERVFFFIRDGRSISIGILKDTFFFSRSGAFNVNGHCTFSLYLPQD